MEKIYVSPSSKRGVGYTNRYFYYLKESLSKYYSVLEADNKPCSLQGLSLLRNAFRADIFLLSQVEAISFQRFGLFQFCLAVLSIKIMRLRRKRIAFILHYIHPHQGENFFTKALTKIQLRDACLVITHSRHATKYAIRELHFFGMDAEKVKYICRPIRPGNATPELPKWEKEDTIYDVLIWGEILPYKGISEFVSDPMIEKSGLKVKIVGDCGKAELTKKLTDSWVSFENRRAGFPELYWYCTHSRFVLFPYLVGSISSSGVLMDTIAMNGTPIGPAIGAFKDLAEERVCVTYNSIKEMVDILTDKKQIEPVTQAARDEFISRNSWENYAEFLKKHIR